MKRKIFIIGNPVAGGGALTKIRKAEGLLGSRGGDVQLMLTGRKGDAELFAREISIKEGPDALVIAAGGDGTYNEVANGLVHSTVPMAILSLGTTSVLANEIGIPADIEKALDIALNGRIRTIHMGKITCAAGSSRENITRYFLLMAGIGFDGETVFGISERLKSYAGKGAYILSGVRALMRYNPPPLEIKFDGFPVVTGSNAIISKAACYGGSFKITPDAQLTEPFLYAFVTHKNSRFDLLRYVAGVVKGNPTALRDASYFRATRIEVNGQAHIQIDGDYAGTTPAKIEAVPDALRLVFGH